MARGGFRIFWMRRWGFLDLLRRVLVYDVGEMLKHF
jgi:hypothetical protein